MIGTYGAPLIVDCRGGRGMRKNDGDVVGNSKHHQSTLTTFLSYKYEYRTVLVLY